VGDVFPRIRKDFKEKSSIPRPSGRGFFIYTFTFDFSNKLEKSKEEIKNDDSADTANK
jgi:hypothetical protein